MKELFSSSLADNQILLTEVPQKLSLCARELQEAIALLEDNAVELSDRIALADDKVAQVIENIQALENLLESAKLQSFMPSLKTVKEIEQTITQKLDQIRNSSKIRYSA